MKIEAVVVCYKYADYLFHTLPEMQQHLDRIVVVTHPDDYQTKTLCAKLGVDCLDTTEFHRDGDRFNKGRAINLGLSHLRHEDWLLHLDADVVLPHRFREMLKHAQLDRTCVYGADRLNVESYEQWEQHKANLIPQHAWRFLVSPYEEFGLGSRLLHMEYGYCPIGYFQLWHSSMMRKYPIVAGSAEHSDVLFSIQWPRQKRILLPEFFVYHLMEKNDKMGENWKGRTTPQFGKYPFNSSEKQTTPRY